MKDFQTKTCNIHFKAGDEQTGTAEMIVAVFNNEDEGKDIILPGFFAKSLEKRRTVNGQPKVKGVWFHEWDKPIAKTLEAKELLPGDALLPEKLSTLGGLYIKAQFNLETQRGREAYSDLKAGIIDEFSIGYSAIKSEYNNETGVRTLIEGELFEWSPVLVGMNDETVLMSVKANQPLEKQIKNLIAESDSLRERVRSLKGLREADGREISAERRDQVKALITELRASADAFEKALEDDPSKAGDLQKEFLRFQKLSALQNGAGKVQ